MSEAGTITAYLQRLDDELRMKRAPRQRLLAEAEDHLRSTVDELVGEGVAPAEAERQAVARFGAAADVARRFAHAAASSTARTAVLWSGIAFLAYGIAAITFVGAAPGWLRDFPHGAPSALALQVAAVAMGVTAVRALGWRRATDVDEGRLRLIANGSLVASLAVGAGTATELLVALTRPAPAAWSEASAVMAIYCLAAVGCIPAILVATAGFARASGLDALPRSASAGGGRSDLTLGEDVAALAPLAGRAVRAALRRPGWTCSVVTGTAFVTTVLAQLAGTDFTHHASILIGGMAVAALEAAAIVIGFLALGRPLGLRGARPRQT